MITADLTRRETFSAAHRLCNPDWTDQENQDVFGKCTNTHGHNYVLEATVRGLVDTQTGMVINLTTVKAAMQDILAHFDHKNLEHDLPPEIQALVPVSTAEVLAHALFALLDVRLGKELLYKIRLYETEKNWVTVKRGQHLG